MEIVEFGELLGLLQGGVDASGRRDGGKRGVERRFVGIVGEREVLFLSPDSLRESHRARRAEGALPRLESRHERKPVFPRIGRFKKELPARVAGCDDGVGIPCRAFVVRAKERDRFHSVRIGTLRKDERKDELRVLYRRGLTRGRGKLKGSPSVGCESARDGNFI